MKTTALVQPKDQLGLEIAKLLETKRPARIIFVSAFTALKTLLRLRDRMLAAAKAGASLRLIVGIDLGGTSREALEELLHWNCEVFVYHNPNPRATFHPKIYLFENMAGATIFIGSNNLTDGGLFTNYEAATRHRFMFPGDVTKYRNLVKQLKPFLSPAGPTVKRLDARLIQILADRGTLVTELEARKSRRAQPAKTQINGTQPPPNPFSPAPVQFPPLISRATRKAVQAGHKSTAPKVVAAAPSPIPPPQGILVWQKSLPKTDALQVGPNTHHVGGVRLTQAGFENPVGTVINQTTYFRSLFDDYDWEQETEKHADQEHAFVPMRIIILGKDYGVRNFEISHKPSGEAGQANYTTILRWGRSFNDVVEKAKLTGKTFSLYEIPDPSAQFLIEIK